MSHVVLGVLSLSPAPAPQPRLDVFMLTGFLLAFAQVTCFINRRRSRDMSIGLMITSMALVVYATMAGVWPLAMVQLTVAISSAMWVTRRLRSQRRRRSRKVRLVGRTPLPTAPAQPWTAESRLHRMFGPPGIN